MAVCGSRGHLESCCWSVVLPSILIIRLIGASYTLKAWVSSDRQAGERKGHRGERGEGGEGETCLAPFCCSYVVLSCWEMGLPVSVCQAATCQLVSVCVCIFIYLWWSNVPTRSCFKFWLEVKLTYLKTAIIIRTFHHFWAFSLFLVRFCFS